MSVIHIFVALEKLRRHSHSAAFLSPKTAPLRPPAEGRPRSTISLISLSLNVQPSVYYSHTYLFMYTIVLSAKLVIV